MIVDNVKFCVRKIMVFLLFGSYNVTVERHMERGRVPNLLKWEENQ